MNVEARPEAMEKARAPVGCVTGALDEPNYADKPGSVRADIADSPAIPTSRLPATRRRLYDNLQLSEERDPYSALLVTG
jgi:hypothetical protein